MCLSKTAAIFLFAAIGISFVLPSAQAQDHAIKIKTEHDRYIRAHPGEYARVDQNDFPGAWEYFTIVRFPKDHRVALRTAHGTFLRVDEEGNVNTKYEANDWEKFEMIRRDGDDDDWGFKTAHGTFLSAQPGTNGLIKANSYRIGDWEEFDLD